MNNNEETIKKIGLISLGLSFFIYLLGILLLLKRSFFLAANVSKLQEPIIFFKKKQTGTIFLILGLIVIYFDYLIILGVCCQIFVVYKLFSNVFPKILPIIYEFKLLKIVMEYINKLLGYDDKNSKLYKDSIV